MSSMMDETARWIPGKISEMMVDFAGPLLDVLGQPRGIEDLRHVMMLAALCWNLPVLEREQAPDFDETKRSFEGALATMPEPLPSMLRQLIEDRRARFGTMPFYVVVEVRGDSLDNAVIRAEARGFEA